MKLSMNAPALAVMAGVALMMTTASAQAQMVYVSTNYGYFGTIDVTTGLFTQVASATDWMGTQEYLYGLALSPDGKTLYALDANADPNLYTVNLTTGALTLVGSTGISTTPINTNNSMVFGSGGTLYAVDGTSNLYTINTTTGAATEVGPIGNTSTGGVAYQGNLYEIDPSNPSNNNLDVINTTTGAGTVIGPTGYFNIYGMVSAMGTVYAFDQNNDILTINTGTGAATLVGGTSLPAGSQDYILAATNTGAVPEPGAYALAVSLGLTGAAFLRRRRAR